MNGDASERRTAPALTPAAPAAPAAAGRAASASRPSPLPPDDRGRLIWGNGVIEMVFAVADGPVRLTGVSGAGMRPASQLPAEPGAAPIIEVLTSVSGRTMNHQRLTDTRQGAALRFVSASAWTERGRRMLRIVQRGACLNGTLETRTVFSAAEGVSVVGCMSTITADAVLPVESVSSLCMTVPLAAAGATADRVEAYWALSTWAAENDWRHAPLRTQGVAGINTAVNPRVPGARMVRSSRSTWSCGEHLPDGILELRGERPASLMWQVEHNGAWSWEVGEGVDGLHVCVGGPNGDNHQWAVVLRDGVSFTTVPASMAVCAGDWRQAVAQMTLHRRALRDDHRRACGRDASTDALVVYNDYMNTLFGDPTADKELPLIEAAGRLGVDVFCIDAGWYDSTDGGWWDMVGEWEPSTNRFGAGGLDALARAVRKAGMGLGLWLEPEVVGVASPLARTLPDEAFFCRHGMRVADDGRYHLDFRSQAARRHLDRTVDRLIDRLGPVFFKFDYNTVPGVGTDVGVDAPGQGLLEHCRAYLDWLDGLRRRHPGVMIENCGSGAMRADYAMLARLDLQSTSDQCDPLIYAGIAAGAGLSILPEQQGDWAYAQPEMDDETAVFTLAAGILGRLYLSGFIDRMDESRLALVREAIAVHRRVLAVQPRCVPYWPLGLPEFDGDWLASGLVPAAMVAGTGRSGRSGPSDCGGYMTIWRRGGDRAVVIEAPQGAGLRRVFPPDGYDCADWSVERVDATHLRVAVPATVPAGTPTARVFAIEPSPPGS